MSAAARPWQGRRLHFIGVGGAGMSGYARASAALGAEVSGSDSARTPYLARLEEDGVLRAHVGYRAENIPAGGGVEAIYSSAVPADNVERAAVREHGLSERPRAELLAELTGLRRTIAVGGTHGKTTTSAMLVHALRAAGLDPGWLVGGSIGDGLANARWSDSEWLVVEADESDRSMLSLQAEVALVTNVELDHHAAFASLAELREAFSAFLAPARWGVVWDRPELLELRAADARVAFDAESVRLTAGGSRFTWHGREVTLAVPGVHNARNAAAALEGALLAGADPARAIAGVEAFKGAARRFQELGRSAGGAVVYDDYAHHPSEVAATLAAARTLPHARLLAVFQPHLFSRTQLLARELGRALARADVVAVLDVYPARERAADFPGVSGLMVAEAVADARPGMPIYWLPTQADAEPVLRRLLAGPAGSGTLAKRVCPGSAGSAARDVCVVMGAGDVDSLARRLVGV
jgi:UDP-N-acetylmuramate--alanine ligase